MNICFAMFMFLYVDVMVMSSAYVVSFPGASGVGVKRCVTQSCGIPVLNGGCVDV